MKNQSGITLVALVVTIIVLLILAGVTISAVMGENGIANKAKEAAIKTDEEGYLEEVKLLIAEHEMLKAEDSTQVTGDLPAELERAGSLELEDEYGTYVRCEYKDRFVKVYLNEEGFVTKVELDENQDDSYVGVNPE